MQQLIIIYLYENACTFDFPVGENSIAWSIMMGSVGSLCFCCSILSYTRPHSPFFIPYPELVGEVGSTREETA